MNDNNAETFIFWIKIPDTSGYQRIFNESSARRFGINDSTSDTCPRKLRFRAFCSGDDGIWNTVDDFPENEWTHVAIAYDHSSLTNKPDIYINGAKQAIVTVSQPDNTPGDFDSTCYFGYTSSGALSGYISDMAFYNTTLTADEILGIYSYSTLDLENYGPTRTSANLLLWWRMGDGPGDSAASIIDQMGSANLTAGGSPAGTPALIDLAFGNCFRSPGNFALPDRTGANSNQTVIVNHFSSPGDYKTLSRGYLDPAHEELSVYNAAPYRNREVIDFGFQGSASLDPSIQGSIRVVDQIGKNRGLNQLATLHCGPFGSDAAYGSVPALSYVTTPSYQKVNRNAKTRIEGARGNAGEFNGTNTIIDIGLPGTWDALIGGPTANAIPFTFGAWVYPRSLGDSNDGRIFEFGAGSDRRLSIQSGYKAYFRISGGSANAYSSAGSLPLHKWTHVLVTYSGGPGGNN